MLTRAKLRESIPDGGTYKGSAEMSFCEPEGTIWGPATINLSSTGHVSVRIDIERYSISDEYNDLLMPFLEGAAPERTATGKTMFRIGGKEKERVGSLKVETPEGHFQASCALVGQCHFVIVGEGKPWCEVIPHDLEFSPGNTDPEEIWSVPLFGDLSKFYGCANTCFIDGPTPYIHFKADGHDCGVQIFRMDGTPETECTAVAFGAVGNRAHANADEANRLMPWGLNAALGFASGSDVRAPWIELRGHDGSLRRRIHQRFGGNEVDSGFAAFSIVDSATAGSGIAEFLRLFFERPQDQRRSITITMNLMRSGAPGNATVDESITNLIKALDATCRRHGFDRVNLAGKLEATTSAEVNSVVAEAREKLKKIRRRCKDVGEIEELAILDKIVSRQSNVAGDELDFGIAVESLLRKFGLNDGATMGTHYLSISPDTTWEGLLSSIRGEVIHSGAIHVDDRADVLSWFQFARHLHDICKRIILREIGYEGTYSASNVCWSGSYKLDRVTPLTSPGQLGYTVPPTLT